MDYAYIGICKCGQVICAIVDNPGRAKTVANEVARWIRAGLIVERATNDYVREHWSQCRCERAEAMPIQEVLF